MGYKTKGNKQTNKQNHRYRQQNVGCQRGREWEDEECERGQIHDNKWKLDFGWCAHCTVHECHIIKLHI